MRIDAYNRISQMYQTGNIKKTAKSSKASASDSFEISNEGKTFQAVKRAVEESVEVREDKVNSIKEQMAAGTYQVSSRQVADKIVDRYFELLG